MQTILKLTLLTSIVATLFFTNSCKKAEPVPSTNHEGFWRANSAIMAGTPFDENVTRSITVKIENDRYETMVGHELDRGDCIVDQAQEPWRMTIKGTDGPNNGKTYPAIYEMNGEDTLRICYNLTGTAYPDTFESNKENGYYTATYHRDTPPN